MNDLNGKNVVITGAASGLGRSLAQVLAAKRCRIGVADIDREGAEATLEMVEGRGGSGEVYGLDVARPEEVEAMACHFFDTWGGVDLMVNDAGVAVTGPVGEVSLEDWGWIMGINFWGMVYGCHSFIPRMKAQGRGHILNVASSAGILSLGGMAPYNCSKAGVIALSETLAVELAPFNVGVTVLCPMFFETNLLKNWRVSGEPDFLKFAKDFVEAAFKYARMSSDQVAESALRAVEKGRLYCIPQPSGRINWVQKRLSPSAFYAQYAFLEKKGWLRPLMVWMARKGLV